MFFIYPITLEDIPSTEITPPIENFEAIIEPILFNRLFQLNYIASSELLAMLQSNKGQNSLLSSNGLVRVLDSRNQLLVRDTIDNLNVISELMARVDVPLPLVEINARILVANEQAMQELGVRLGGRSGVDNVEKLHYKRCTIKLFVRTVACGWCRF